MILISKIQKLIGIFTDFLQFCEKVQQNENSNPCNES